MRGLMTEYDMEPDEFLHFVHEIDLSDVVADPELDSLLARLGGRKHIYTNGTVRHATRILGAFGIRVILTLFLILWHPIISPNRTRNLTLFLLNKVVLFLRHLS